MLTWHILTQETIVFGCLYLIHKDPRYWEKPDTLYPEHFLDAEGKLSQKNEAFLPFSTGKLDQCIFFWSLEHMVIRF